MAVSIDLLSGYIAELPTVPLAIALAFVFGVGARFITLPPLAGFLAAGFVLNALGVRSNEAIKEIADAGVMLLLFTIGLKLKVRTLARSEVWGVATLHCVGTVAVFATAIYGLGKLGIGLFGGMTLEAAALIAFALSFSSTVFGVKVLDERGEANALHGRTAVGILVIQDLFAVAFLSLAAAKAPSIWAFALIGLVLLRPVLSRLLDNVGYRELLPLFGLFSAVVLGAGIFQLVGLKPDLGALVFGAMMAPHKRAEELSDALLSFKEILLIGFFLDIGLSGTPTLEHLLIALILVLLLPLQAGLFFVLMARFRLRARSAFLASLSLATYGEFGLIVCAVSANNGWVDNSWVVVLAMALSLSFFFLAPLNITPHKYYRGMLKYLRSFETGQRHREDMPLEIGDATVAIFGMGRVGTGAYEQLYRRYGGIVIGIESNLEKVEQHCKAGRKVIHGDATDSDFWERVHAAPHKLRAVLLAMPEHRANMFAVQQIRSGNFSGFIGALAKFPEHSRMLEAEGVHAVFNMYAEAGAGFAASVDDAISASLNPHETPRVAAS
jgi:glutathione-regulated potassium-efflux system ancillary protein KefC